MKFNSIISRGLLVAGMFIYGMSMHAQYVPKDSIKVIYPGDSAVVEVPNSQDKYVEQKAVLTPDDEENSLQSLGKIV